ncbi:hypothetical protein [Roseobacter sp. S98]|uniref:hypothetical protein n=1 Tax=Roseobacter algicola (ex Choi et al. 2025) (nom. illeg.) TaxID=3092138 RepID=UPI0035C6864E
MAGTDIFCTTREQVGWVPIHHMIRLAAQAFDARIINFRRHRISRMARVRTALTGAPRSGADVAICILRSPQEIDRMLRSEVMTIPYRIRVLWIIDSFRTHHLPPAWQLKSFDVIAYCQRYDQEEYESRFGDRALFLGWGSDALNLGSAGPERAFDILRIGRQPPAWDDDGITTQKATAQGLVFQGRPPDIPDLSQQQPVLLRDYYGQSRFVIAHSNLAAPESYTHKSKEYITARWTDALASGAVVAGVPPHSDLGLIDWPGALLPFDRIDLDANLAQLAAARAAWTPQMALDNHLGALKQLDWRWRFHTLSKHIGLRPAALDAEIDRLNSRIAALTATQEPLSAS